MKYLLFILLALAVNAQPFGLRDPAFLGALKPKVSSSISPDPAGLLNGLLAYWKSDESSGDLIDSTVNGNTMFASGTGMAYSDTGILGTSVLYDGGVSKFQTVGYILPATDFTISLWFKTSDTGTTERIYDTEDSGIAVAINFPSVGKVGIYAAGCGVYQSSTIGLNDGIYHHLSLLYVSNNLSLYIDGLLDTDFGNIGAYTAGTGFDCLGGYANGTQQGIVGNLDEIGVWNHGLTLPQIKALAAPYPFSSFTP